MTLFPSLITIFFVILVGVFCYKKEIFNKTQIDGFELLLFKIIMPSYLFAASYKNDLSTLLNTEYIAAYLLTFGILALIVTVLFIKELINHRCLYEDISCVLCECGHIYITSHYHFA